MEGVAALKAQLSSITRLIELLQILPIADPSKPIDPSDGRLLLYSAATYCAKDSTPGEQPFSEPGAWTLGVVLEGLAELAADCGKPVESCSKQSDNGSLPSTSGFLPRSGTARPYLNVRLFTRGASLSTARARIGDLVFSELRREVVSHTFAIVIGAQREGIMNAVAASTRERARDPPPSDRVSDEPLFVLA
jgi:hypothetical protein